MMNKSPDFSYELSLVPKNCRYILGIDEVGRGPWAGSVAVGAFILDTKDFDSIFFQQFIKDSKCLLPQKREKAFKEIQNRDYAFKVFTSSSDEIDKLGIQKTIINSIEKAIIHFNNCFDFVLIDGNLKIDLGIPHKSVIKADLNCFSVAAASICAKVVRDREMIEFDKIFPGYDFSNNKGYGTKSHILGLEKLGPCPIHRQSYKPIKKYYSSKKFSSQ